MISAASPYGPLGYGHYPIPGVARSGHWAQAINTSSSIMEPEPVATMWLPLVRYWVYRFK
jgi:hypothetical protein